MNPQLQPLVRLQALDLRGAEIKDQRRKIPDLLQTAEQPLQEAQQRLQRTADTFESGSKARRDREGELEAQELHIQKLKARASEIKKNVEYQAHLFEIQMADKKKGEIEEQILVLMEELEQHQQTVRDAKAKVAEAEATYHSKKTELEALDAKLAEELTGLTEEQTAVTQSVEKALLDRYNKLKNTRKELAVARIMGGICSGCRLQLAPQLVAEVRRSEQILSCSFCHRILYWEEDAAQGSGSAAESADRAAGGLSGRR